MSADACIETPAFLPAPAQQYGRLFLPVIAYSILHLQSDSYPVQAHTYPASQFSRPCNGAARDLLCYTDALFVLRGQPVPQNDILFGLPVVLDTDSEEYAVGDQVLLQYQGQDLAVFMVESKWVPNKPLEAKHCYGTTSIEHPAVQMISMERGKFYMGEPLLCRASCT